MTQYFKTEVTNTLIICYWGNIVSKKIENPYTRPVEEMLFSIKNINKNSKIKTINNLSKIIYQRILQNVSVSILKKCSKNI